MNTFTNKLFAFSLFATLCACVPFAKKESAFVKQHTADKAMNAVARLGVKVTGKEGTFDLCGASAISRNGDEYEFLTAGHYATVYKASTKETQPLTTLFPIKFFLVFESEGGDTPVTEMPAELVAYGDRGQFEDFAIFKVKTTRNIPLLPLYKGKDPVRIGEELVVVVAPLERMGNLYLTGHISKPEIKVNYEVVEVNIKGAIPTQILGLGIGKGSSGSSVLSVKKNAVIGVISTTSFNEMGHVTLSLCPMSKFHPFYARYKKGLIKVPKTENVSLLCENPTEECLELLKTYGMPIRLK